MGVDTGIDLTALLALRAKVAGWLEGEPTARRDVARRPARRPSPPAPPLTMHRETRHERTSTHGLPLEGIRVIEFTHMVMGPTCGMILADLGAEVIKIEPPGGDKTRKLPGLGIGFFRSFNRNKKSVVLDINTPEGHAAALELIGQCDVMLENFRPGLMTKLGLDYDTLSQKFPRLIYASHKGFLPGPYENRLALDEVVQNMAGLTYMTGPEGRPLRAGIVGQRHHGRHVRRDRRAGRAARARPHRPGPGDPERAVRELLLAGRAAHAAVPDDRRAARRRCPRACRPGACTTSSPWPTTSNCSSAPSATSSSRRCAA